MNFYQKLNEDIKKQFIIWLFITMCLIFSFIYYLVIICIQQTFKSFIFLSMMFNLLIGWIQIVGFCHILGENQIFYVTNLYDFITNIYVIIMCIFWIVMCVVHVIIPTITEQQIFLTIHDYIILISNTTILGLPIIIGFIVYGLYPLLVNSFGLFNRLLNYLNEHITKLFDKCNDQCDQQSDEQSFLISMENIDDE